MADVKISGLPASTTPLDGTEVLPIVQGTTTKQVSVANLTAGRAVAALSTSTSSYQLASGGVITESTTSRTLSAGDNGKVIYCTSASAVTITTAAGLGAGFSCVIIQGAAGKVTIAQGASTTRVAYGSLYATGGTYATISIICPVADTFLIAGNIGA